MDGKNITVVIAGRPYPLNVKEDDEAAIRKIVKEINEKVNRFQLTYTNKDKQDCLSMALLTYAVDLYRSNINSAQEASLSTKLANLEKLLDELDSKPVGPAE
jgi:cell division protein ZapA